MDIIAFGNNSCSKLGTDFDNIKLNPSKLTKVKAVKRIVCGRSSTLVHHVDSTLSVLGSNGGKLAFPKNESIKKICNGRDHYIILTYSGNVYSYGHGSRGQMGLGSTVQKVTEPTIIDYFVKKKIQIRDFACTLHNTFFIDKQNHLWACGAPEIIPFLHTTVRNVSVPVQLGNVKVKTIYGGVQAEHIFIIYKNDNKLYSYGNNNFYRCGGKFDFEDKIPKRIELFDVLKINDIICSNCNSIVLYNNRVYSCGYNKFSGHGTPNRMNHFEQIQEFARFKIMKIFGGSSHFWAVDEDKNFWRWGFNFHYQLGDHSKMITVPQKFNLDYLNSNIRYTISCGPFCTIFYPHVVPSLNKDLSQLIGNPTFSDLEIKGCKVISTILSCRTGGKAQTIIKLFENNNYEYKQVKQFMKWVYGDQIIDFKLMERIEKESGLTGLFQRNYQNDLTSLWNDNNSKDFVIRIPNIKYSQKSNNLMVPEDQNENSIEEYYDKCEECSEDEGYDGEFDHYEDHEDNGGEEDEEYDEDENEDENEDAVNENKEDEGGVQNVVVDVEVEKDEKIEKNIENQDNDKNIRKENNNAKNVNDDNNQQNEENKNMEKPYKEIALHKFILAARSKVFFELFLNIEPDIKEISDYSQKKFESLMILFKFFYSSQIELTQKIAFRDLIEDLSDAEDYYQLNPKSLLKLNLEQLKNDITK
ncbi:btk-binding protein-related [Anaeramoeba flamelloides]|uniref:Btk-binding protein-related n=1 Tax=Anaeramoeba flamelloides TaxID=1746091 RepID=A0AAV7YBC8_9EUKA|nr:btk-binding protein-related [Anaeramoeba flamelloides]